MNRAHMTVPITCYSPNRIFKITPEFYQLLSCADGAKHAQPSGLEAHPDGPLRVICHWRCLWGSTAALAGEE